MGNVFLKKKKQCARSIISTQTYSYTHLPILGFKYLVHGLNIEYVFSPAFCVVLSGGYFTQACVALTIQTESRIIVTPYSGQTKSRWQPIPAEELDVAGTCVLGLRIYLWLASCL